MLSVLWEYKVLLLIQKMSVEEGVLECGSGQITVSTAKIMWPDAAQTTSKCGAWSVLIFSFLSALLVFTLLRTDFNTKF